MAAVPGTDGGLGDAEQQRAGGDDEGGEGGAVGRAGCQARDDPLAASGVSWRRVERRVADQKAVYNVIIFVTTVGLIIRRRLSARQPADQIRAVAPSV